MYIGTPEIVRTADSTEYRVPFTVGRCVDETLWFRVANEFADFLSPRADAALLSLLVPAMQTGGTIQVEGPVTDELVHGLHHGFMDLQLLSTEGLRDLRIEPLDPRPADPSAPAVLTGLSGGVDSFAVIADYFYADDVPASLRPTHLLFSDVVGHYDNAVMVDKRRRLAPVADRMGLPFVLVDSNLPQLLPRFGLNALTYNTPVSVAVGYLLQRGVGTLLFGPPTSFRSLNVVRTHEIALLDPITLPLISTSAMRLVSAGAEYRRIDKYARIATVPGIEQMLDVCITQHLGGNCSQCFKCMRTQAGLEIVGLRDRFDPVFDREIWQRRRVRYLRGIQRTNTEFAREIVDEAAARGIRLPRPYPFHMALARLARRWRTRP